MLAVITLSSIKVLLNIQYRYEKTLYSLVWWFMAKIVKPSIKQKLCKIFSANLLKYRKIEGYKQEEVAEAVDLSQSFYSKAELGKSLVGLEVYYELSKLFGLSPGGLLSDPSDIDKNSEKIDSIVAMLKGASEKDLEAADTMLRTLFKVLENRK